MNLNNQYHFDQAHYYLKKNIQEKTFFLDNNKRVFLNIINCGQKKNQAEKAVELLYLFKDNEIFLKNFIKYVSDSNNPTFADKKLFEKAFLKFTGHIYDDNLGNDDFKAFWLFFLSKTHYKMAPIIKKIPPELFFLPLEKIEAVDSNCQFLKHSLFLDKKENNFPIGVLVLYDNLESLGFEDFDFTIKNEYLRKEEKEALINFKNNTDELLRKMADYSARNNSQQIEIFNDFLYLYQMKIDWSILKNKSFNMSSRIIDIEFFSVKNKNFQVFKKSNRVPDYFNRARVLLDMNDDVLYKNRHLIDNRICQNILDNNLYNSTNLIAESILSVSNLSFNSVIDEVVKENQFKEINSLTHFECAMAGLSIKQLGYYGEQLLNSNNHFFMTDRHIKIIDYNLSFLIDFSKKYNHRNGFTGNNIYTISNFLIEDQKKLNGLDYDFISKEKKEKFINFMLKFNTSDEIQEKRNWFNNFVMKKSLNIASEQDKILEPKIRKKKLL